MEQARREGERIRAEATERCGKLRDDAVQSARAKADAEAEQARAAGEAFEREAAEETRAQTERLRASAGEKEQEAVGRVLSLLV